jgi:hypothetical protein
MGALFDTGEEPPAIAEARNTEATAIAKIDFIVICQYPKHNASADQHVLLKI